MKKETYILIKVSCECRGGAPGIECAKGDHLAQAALPVRNYNSI